MEKINKKLEMKFLFFAAALMILLLTNPIILVSAADLEIALENYSPRPVTPGNFFTANFRADNSAGKNLTDIVIEIKNQSPFFIEGSNKINIVSLGKGESKTFSFLIGVKSSSSSGFKDLDIEWQANSTSGTSSGKETFSIQVKAIETSLVVESVESFPSEIPPGEKATIKVRLKNNADIQLRNIKVKLNLNSAELPFAPIESVTERNIAKLGSGEVKEVEFKIITLADSASKIYKVPLEINYFDEFGQEFNTSNVVALIVSSKPLFDFNIDSSLVTGKAGKVNIEIVNKGLSGAKFLNVKLLSSSNYDALGASNFYIGDLDSDDTKTVKFELIAREEAITLPLQITYRDSNNKIYTEIFNLQPKVYNLQEARDIGIIKSNTTFLIILVVIFIVILYFVIRKIRKKRDYRE